MKKLLVMMLLAFALLPAPLSADSVLTVGGSLGSSLYMGISRFTDALPVRLSVTADAALSLGLFSEEKNLEVSLLGAFKFVSYSPFHGGKRARRFIGGGGGLRFSSLLSPRWGLFGEATLFSSRYVVDQRFLSLYFKVGPFCQILREEPWRLAIELPIGLEVRKDVLGLTVGLMARLNYDLSGEGRE